MNDLNQTAEPQLRKEIEELNILKMAIDEGCIIKDLFVLLPNEDVYSKKRFLKLYYKYRQDYFNIPFRSPDPLYNKKLIKRLINDLQTDFFLRFSKYQKNGYWALVISCWFLYFPLLIWYFEFAPFLIDAGLIVLLILLSILPYKRKFTIRIWRFLKSIRRNI